ncbi:MAG: hypothetical protein K6E51_05560 [Treponema sp.]|nr:hypothetical protein [Treponema sp.]
MSIKTDVVHKQGSAVAVSGTAVIWGLLLLIGIFLPIAPHKEEYKEIKITLASSSSSSTGSISAAAPAATANQVDKQVASAAPAKKAVEKVETQKTPAEIKKASTSSQKTSAESKSASAPSQKVPAETQKAATDTPKAPAAKKRPIEIKKSTEELMAEAESTMEKKSVTWDESLFDSDAAKSQVVQNTSTQTAASQSNAVTQQIAVTDALKGSDSQVVAQSSSEATVSTNAAAIDRTGSGTASTSTATALGKIENAVYTYTAGNGVSASTSVSGTKGASGVAMQMSDGSSRLLLDPAEPQIRISDENAMTIDSTKTVTIVFTVLEDGSVPPSSIQITPSAALQPAVQSEIRAQLKLWRFETATYQSTASFEYTIVKK